MESLTYPLSMVTVRIYILDISGNISEFTSGMYLYFTGHCLDVNG